MVPTIGLMIGCYICFRCVEVWCKASDEYSEAGRYACCAGSREARRSKASDEYSEAGRYVANGAALLLLLLTLFLVVDLMLSGHSRT